MAGAEAPKLVVEWRHLNRTASTLRIIGGDLDWRIFGESILQHLLCSLEGILVCLVEKLCYAVTGVSGLVPGTIDVTSEGSLSKPLQNYAPYWTWY